MIAAGYPDIALHQAYGMKRGYLRALPRAMLPKQTVSHEEESHGIGKQEQSLQLRNYPNPFNPSTTIEYLLAEEGHATLCMYNPLGRRIATLVDGWQRAGQQRIAFDAPAWLSSGIYSIVLTSPTGMVQKKMLLAR